MEFVGYCNARLERFKLNILNLKLKKAKTIRMLES